MPATLYEWLTLHKILLNTILVSIPEELFLVMFTLILVGEFEHWKDTDCKKLINKWDYSRILIPTISCALISNILRYYGLYESFIYRLIPIIVCYILIVLTNDIFNDASSLKWMLKSFLFFLLSIVILAASEIVYLPFVLEGTGMTVPEINNNILMNFLASLPSRIIQYSILIFLIVRKRRQLA